MKNNLKRGDIVYVDLGQHPDSSVQSGFRPCIVVSNDMNNKYAKTINVIPFSSKMKKNPVHVVVKQSHVKGFLDRESDCLAEQITTIDKKRIISKIGHIPEESLVMKQINNAMRLQFGLA